MEDSNPLTCQASADMLAKLQKIAQSRLERNQVRLSSASSLDRSNNEATGKPTRMADEEAWFAG
jgi:hypothetical protein